MKVLHLRGDTLLAKGPLLQARALSWTRVKLDQVFDIIFITKYDAFDFAFALPEKKTPRVRKIFVRNSGAGNGCVNFMDAWKNAFFLQEKPMYIKFLVLGGRGILGFLGGGSADFSESYLIPREDWIKDAREKRTALLTVGNAFNCNGSPYGFHGRGSRRSPKRWPKQRTPARVKYSCIRGNLCTLPRTSVVVSTRPREINFRWHMSSTLRRMNLAIRKIFLWAVRHPADMTRVSPSNFCNVVWSSWRTRHYIIPDLPLLPFQDFLAFCFCKELLAFFSVFPFFSRNLRGSAERKYARFFYFSSPLLLAPCLKESPFSCGATTSILIPNTQPLQVAFSLLLINRIVKMHKNKWVSLLFTQDGPRSIEEKIRVLLNLWFAKRMLVFPVSRKSPWIHFGFKKVKLERNADNSGREFWAWIFRVARNPGKTRPKNSLSKFAIKIRWEIRRQFS